jgi:hypothetical protein
MDELFISIQMQEQFGIAVGDLFPVSTNRQLSASKLLF